MTRLASPSKSLCRQSTDSDHPPVALDAVQRLRRAHPQRAIGAPQQGAHRQMPRRGIAQLLPVAILIVVNAVECGAEQHAAGVVAYHHEHTVQLDAGGVLAVVHSEIAP
ncbi:hypothetical protein XocUg1_15805, partial [Xanthomonas oryzae pv. oryzicola]|uniref:hypothetical protein n=1 Tax=Xanthomonas oryzae TaxID=347 RepID=UPI002DEDB92E|nr:hypothetical protein [Xanthomonas oryzae pv. oryzicola]